VALAFQFLHVGLLITVALSVAAYFGTWHEVFDLASQLRLQLLVSALLGLICTLLKRQWSWSVVALLGIALNVWPVAVWYLPQRNTASHSQRIKLVQYNVRYEDDGYQAVLDFLHAEQPDIVALQEVNPEWAAGLQPLTTQFAATLIAPEGWGNGIALYSQIKFTKTEIIDMGNDHRPSLLVQFAWAGRTVSLLTIHPPNPFGPNRFAWRNGQLTATADLLQSLPSPQILLGDLNTTMWSPYYQQLVARTQLVNARAGHGLVPTWPAPLRLPLLMIPIDHCLVSRDIAVVSIRTGRRLGSDHLPLVVELALPQK
jgi:endonuclease/exonuclease/phosphatase (EEP) superfamily protein YafD